MEGEPAKADSSKRQHAATTDRPATDSELVDAHAFTQLLIESTKRQIPDGAADLDAESIEHSIEKLEQLANNGDLSRATKLLAQNIADGLQTKEAPHKPGTARNRKQVLSALRSDLLGFAVSCEFLGHENVSTSIIKVLTKDDAHVSVNNLMSAIEKFGAARNTPEPLQLASQLVLERYQELRGVVVNVGSGHNPMPNAVNVDRELGEGVQVLADANKLPFRDNSVDEINAINPHGYAAANKSAANALKPGGTMYASGNSKRNKWVNPDKALASSSQLEHGGTEALIPDHDFGQAHLTRKADNGSLQPINMDWHEVVTHVLTKPEGPTLGLR